MYCTAGLCVHRAKDKHHHGCAKYKKEERDEGRDFIVGKDGKMGGIPGIIVIRRENEGRGFAV